MRHVGNIVAKLKRGEAGPNRHHNPYLQEAIALESIVYTQNELENLELPNLFPTPQPLILEIGCYMGKTLIELAEKNAELNFFGVDLTYKRTVKSGRKIKNHKLDNARIGICDGASLVALAKPEQFSGTCVFFPDPWNKLKQRKNRLLKKEFFTELRSKTCPNGFFWFKTDALGYFEEAVSAAQDAGWQKTEEKIPAPLIGGGYQTSFELMFEGKGIPHYAIVLRKEN